MISGTLPVTEELEKHPVSSQYTVFFSPSTYSRLAQLIEPIDDKQWPCTELWLRASYVEDIIWAGPIWHLVFIADISDSIELCRDCDAQIENAIIDKMKRDMRRFARLVYGWQKQDKKHLAQFFNEKLLLLHEKCTHAVYDVKWQVDGDESSYTLTGKTVLNGNLSLTVSFDSNDATIEGGLASIRQFTITSD